MAAQIRKRKTFWGESAGRDEERGVCFWRYVRRVGKLKQRLASGVSKIIRMGKKKGDKATRWSTRLWKLWKSKNLQKRGESFWRQESYLWVSKKVDEKREWGNKNDNDEKIINHPLRSTLHKLPFSYRMSEHDLVLLFPKKNISVFLSHRTTMPPTYPRNLSISNFLLF